jgi:hypothetical protein
MLDGKNDGASEGDNEGVDDGFVEGGMDGAFVVFLFLMTRGVFGAWMVSTNASSLFFSSSFREPPLPVVVDLGVLVFLIST